MIANIANLLKKTIVSLLDKRVAISFSGGVDSSTIAIIARKYANVHLFTAGVKGSPDIEYAQKIASELNLPLSIVVADEHKVLEIYKKCYGLVPKGLLVVEILIPVYLVAETVAADGYRVLLFGSGAEEVFAGYQKYYRALEENKDVDSILKEEFRTLPERDIAYVKKICNSFAIEARFPFYNKQLADLVFSIPLLERMNDRENKKGILRQAAHLLGVPKLAVARRKQAMQYGSGIHKIILKNAELINKNYPWRP